MLCLSNQLEIGNQLDKSFNIVKIKIVGVCDLIQILKIDFWMFLSQDPTVCLFVLYY